MKETRIDKKEYSVIVNLIIFFSIIIVVATVRLVVILSTNTPEITKEEYLYITEKSNLTKKDMTSTNIQVINQIEGEYNVEIYYGEEATRFAKSVNAISLTDDKKLTSMLFSLSSALEKYPNNIIKEIKSDGYDVSIYLVDHFTNSNVAIANRNSNNEFKIYLSSNSSFERAMHHETYHILEYYMNLEYGLDTLFISWDTLNPKGFEYTGNVDNINSDYVYGKDIKKPSYFATLYSKYSAKEDRAEMFAESMTSINNDRYNSIYIKDKMKLINTNIRKCFSSANNGNKNYWEKNI